MNPKITLALVSAFILTAATAPAQTIVPIAVTGFTDDVVANGPGPAATSTTEDMDGGSGVNRFCFVAPDFVNPAGDTPSSSLPLGGLVSSVQSPFPTFQLADYSAPNSLRLPGLGSGTLTLTTPRAANELWLLGASGNLSSEFDAQITFTDQTTQVFPNLLMDDWFNGFAYAIMGVSRVNYTTDIIQHSAVNPRLYQMALPIAAANQAKLIQSVTFTKLSAQGTLNVMGLSAAPSTMGTVPAAPLARLSVSPNPVTGHLTIECPADAGGTIELLDLTGRVVLSTEAELAATTLDVSALPAGVYVVRYADARQHRMARVVKE